jgi:uncharacterized membrane protein YccC
MATCPRCYGPLNAHHKCRPRWIRRAVRETLITLIAASVGALFSIAFWPHHVPVLGMVIAGTLGWGFAAITKYD